MGRKNSLPANVALFSAANRSKSLPRELAELQLIGRQRVDQKCLVVAQSLGLVAAVPAVRLLQTMPGEFSGLQLVCYMYVGFQIVAPGTDIGFDLSREYRIAKSMHSD